jgi:hypothetical protein
MTLAVTAGRMLAFGFGTGASLVATAGLLTTVAGLGKLILMSRQENNNTESPDLQGSISLTVVGGAIARLAAIVIGTKACAYSVALAAATAAIAFPIWALYANLTSEGDQQPSAIPSIDLSTTAVASGASIATAIFVDYSFKLGLFLI